MTDDSGRAASPKEWDAATYHRVADPQFNWGVRVLERLPLAGDETVIDAGCGSGRLTELLLERLPRGRVIALDRSSNMLEAVRGRLLPRHAGRLELMEADLGALSLEGVADAVFSTATFHWVLDHRALFGGLRRALRPGGRLVAQCGGAGNLDRFLARTEALCAEEPYRRWFQDWTRPHL